MEQTTWSGALFAALLFTACSPPLPGEDDGGLFSDAGVPLDAGVQADGGNPLEADAGVTAPVQLQGSFVRASAAEGSFASFSRDQLHLSQTGRLELAPGLGKDGKDPLEPGTYNGVNYYNGGTFRYGVAQSAEYLAPWPFDELVPSYDVSTPAGTWFEVRVSVRIAGVWTRDFELGIWANHGGAITPHSASDGSGGPLVDVQGDTLFLRQKADAFRLAVLLFSESPMLTPSLRGLAAALSASGRAAPVDPPDSAVWGKVLPVPKRSQMIYAGGGSVWCSPTSLTMVMAYYGTRLSVPELIQPVPITAAGVKDIYFRHGNWGFNVAYGTSLAGGALHGVLVRMTSFSQLERLIAADIPAIISIAYAAGELTGSPITDTDGHIVVVKGFAANGDVVVNGPAFTGDANVEVTYKRAELEKIWQKHSAGLAYVLWPAGTSLPMDPLGAFR